MPISRRSALGRIGLLPFLLAACGREVGESPIVAGRAMPELSLADLDGRSHGVGGTGRPWLVNFWATWCPPCRAEMGGLERLHRDFSGAGLAVVGISVDDDPNLVREFILQQGMGFPILWDRNGDLAGKTLGIRVFPTTVLVRRDRIIADVVVGERDWDEGPVRDRVRALV